MTPPSPTLHASIDFSFDPSAQGAGWVQATAPVPSGLHNVLVQSLATDGHVIVAAGYGLPSNIAAAPGIFPGFLWWSSDGRNWARGHIDTGDPNDPIPAVAWANGRFVAILAGVLLTSEDGKEWHSEPAPVGASLAGVAAGPTGFIAFGNDTSAAQGHAPAAWTSEDGLAWDRATMPDDFGYVLSVASNGHGFVAAGTVADAEAESSRPAMWQSVDGHAWTSVEIPQPSPIEPLSVWQIDKVAAFHGGYAAIGASSDPSQPTVWRSPDGLTWEATPLDAIGNRAFRTGSLAVIGNRLVLTNTVDAPITFASSDGRTWVELPAGRGWVSAMLQVGDRVVLGCTTTPTDPTFYVGPANAASFP